MKTAFWFRLVAAVVIGIVVLALLGPIAAGVYAIGAVGLVRRRNWHHRHHRHHHHHHH